MTTNEPGPATSTTNASLPTNQPSQPPDSPRPNPIVGPKAMKWACGLTGVGAGLLLLTLILAANESISQNSNDRCSTILERQAASAAPTSPAAPTTPATPSAPATPAAPTVP